MSPKSKAYLVGGGIGSLAAAFLSLYLIRLASLARDLFISMDPYVRGRMNAGKLYVPPFESGKPPDGGAVGEAVESRAREFKPGDAVTSDFGWRKYFMALLVPSALPDAFSQLRIGASC
jgi:hypothetical protein